MELRRKSHQKPQDLPVDYVKMITEVVEKNFKSFTKDKKIVIDGAISLSEIGMMIGFRNKTGVKQSNFFSSIDHDIKKKNTMDKIYASIDALGSMIAQFIEAEEDIELPLEWTEFDLDRNKIFMKFGTENTDLETQAENLLNPKN